MDIRIVNTCNNDCLYCLESSLRNKDKFISKDSLFTIISKEKDKSNITFFWWNPLLHPDLKEIIYHSYKEWFCWIGLLSNTQGISKKYLWELITEWLSTFWIYFNSFDKKNHEIVNWWWISYEDYLHNLKLLAVSWINLKIIIHINDLNINTVARDVLILREKYWFTNFDFINYFPFDKPYLNKNLLEYNIQDNAKQIELIFKVVKKFSLKVNFMKFSKDFFSYFTEYYNYERGVLNQIWEEDIERLNWKWTPFCYKEKRCEQCFIKDNCRYYGI